MKFSGKFESSNNECPIVYSLVAGDVFKFTSSGGFEVVLREEKRQIPGSYNYSIKAVAEGGAHATRSGTMIVGDACSS